MNETATNAVCSNPVQLHEPGAHDLRSHTVVIGSGPAGVRFVQELLTREPLAHVTLIGNEPYHPYNRVQLSGLLAGDLTVSDITTALPNTALHPNFSQISTHIKAIYPEQSAVEDEQGHTYSYGHLVLATGSRPHVPHIPGTDQAGVYTFRNLKDAESLYGRTARARHVVVIGGGLLGLEAARAMQRANTRVTVIQQGPRLMNRQLDATAAECLHQKVKALGIEIITQDGVRQILGAGRVTGVLTRNGDTIECDTVLLCAGIKPAIELARNAKIKVTTGILVDDALQTSEPNIFAIGECCEHRGKTYGLVNPGFEQAAVCAEVICNGPARYQGSLEVSRLKVVGETVCSMGEVADVAPRPFLREWKYRNKKTGTYRKIVTLKGRVIGAVGFGEWPEVRRIQESYQQQRKLYPWNYMRFMLTGFLWNNSSNDDPALWPATTIICQCNNITQGTLVEHTARGANSATELGKLTGAGTVCGSCKPLLEQLAGQSGPRAKEKTWGTLITTSVLALAASLFIFFTPGLATSDTVQQLTVGEALWNNKLWKQITGFTMLGLSALGLLMALRKRIKVRWLGEFAYWRVFHIALGLACVFILMAHTGLHLGENLNRWLMLNFLMVLVLGSVAAISVAMSHLMSANTSQNVRRFFTWAHILIFWPLPVLLAAHIISVYYF